jgi:hypothetical protein
VHQADGAFSRLIGEELILCHDRKVMAGVTDDICNNNQSNKTNSNYPVTKIPSKFFYSNCNKVLTHRRLSYEFKNYACCHLASSPYDKGYREEVYF